MDQLRKLFESLSWKQRIWLLAAALAVAGGLSWFSHWNQERDFKPLYSNLAPEDASALVTKLKEGGIEYRLGEGGSTILVPSARVSEARLSLAGQGLPKSGRIGFELFDKTNFGASEFAEQVNYHRAVEGEIERTIMSVHEVEQARVHLTFAKESIYTESRQPAKASILLKLKAGSKLSPQNIAAICQLTASAVPELSPDQVSLVDSNGTLLNRPKRPGAADEMNEAALDYKKTIERDLQSKIAATLEPILGPEHYRVSISADIDTSSAEQEEETYDPQKSAMSSSQTSEDVTTQAAAGGGVPGTASNLPRPAAAQAAGSPGASRKTSNVTYQNSRIVRRTKLPQGGVSKLAISVLVDHNVRYEGAKRIVEAPTAEKLMVVHDLVAATAGFNMDRGDQLVVEAFPFESTIAVEPPPAPPAAGAPAVPASPFSNLPLPPWAQKLVGTKNFLVIAGIGAGAIVLLLGLGIFFFLRSRKKKAIVAETAAAALEAKSTPALITPEEMEKQFEARMAEHAALQAKQQAEELMKLKVPEVSTKKTDILTKHISEETKKDPIAMAQVVRSWLNGEDRREV
ncbi:MAG: flagellar basal-body MS-ring/collar protein FliF [Bryobacteraceae bacterium]